MMKKRRRSVISQSQLWKYAEKTLQLNRRGSLLLLPRARRETTFKESLRRLDDGRVWCSYCTVHCGANGLRHARKTGEIKDAIHYSHSLDIPTRRLRHWELWENWLDEFTANTQCYRDDGHKLIISTQPFRNKRDH